MDYNLLQQKHEEYTMDGGNFESLRLEFEKTIKEIKEDPMNQELSPFLREYSKLFMTLLKSHDNEKRLFRKAEELQQKIISLTQSIRTDIKVKKDNLLTKESLDNEVKEIWERVRNSHLKETKQKDLMMQFRREINILRDLLKHGVNIGASSQQRIEVLESERNTVTEKIQDYDDEINKLIKEVGYQQQHILEVEKKLHRHRDHERKISLEVEKHKEQLEQEKRDRVEGEKELKLTRAIIQEKTNEMSELRIHISRQHQEVIHQQNRLQKEIQKMAQLQQRIANLNERKQRLNYQKDRQDAQNEKLLHQTVHLKEEIDQVSKKVKVVQKKDKDVEREAERIKTDTKKIKEAREAIEKERVKYLTRISENQKKLTTLRRDYDMTKTQLDDQTHHKSVLDRMILQINKNVDSKKSNLVIQENKKMNLLRKKKAYRNASEIHRKELYLLKKELLRYEQQQSEAMQKERVALEDIKEHKQRTTEYQRLLKDLKIRIKKHTELLQKVTNDRDEYQKQVQDKVEHIIQKEKSLKFLQKIIDQKKEEMKSTDNKIQRKYIEVEHTKNQTEYYKKLVDQKKKFIVIDRDQLKRKEDQIFKLSKILKDAEEERSLQLNEIESVTNDRDALSTQLIKRNEQLGKLYEKIQLQQNQINLGKRRFNNVMINISGLQSRNNSLQNNKNELIEKLTIIDQLKKEIHAYQKKISTLMNQKKSLEVESEKKMNVHRWRKVEGSNPKLYRMIKRVHRLQKSLIRKNNTIDQKNLLIQQKEKLYVDLKKLVLKQPSGEVFDLLNGLKMKLKKKMNHTKRFSNELKKTKRENKKKKYLLKNVESQFLQIKREYFKRKREQFKPPKDLPMIDHHYQNDRDYYISQHLHHQDDPNRRGRYDDDDDGDDGEEEEQEQQEQQEEEEMEGEGGDEDELILDDVQHDENRDLEGFNDVVVRDDEEEGGLHDLEDEDHIEET